MQAKTVQAGTVQAAARTGRGGGRLVGQRPSALPHPLPDALVDLVARRFRVIGEPMRIKLLDRLRAGEATVQELTSAVGASQQNVSKHLGVLHDAGIVARRKDGTKVLYRVVDAGVFELCETVCGSVQRQVAELHAILEGTGG